MKKKILAISLVISLLAIAVVGGTLAYFTDTKTAENVFTIGDVKIKLNEYADEAKSPYLAEGETEKALNPGVTVNKFVEVENVGKNDAYIRVKYTVDTKALGAIKIDLQGIDGFATVSQEPDAEAGTTTIAVTYNEKVAPDAAAMMIKSTVKLSESFDWEYSEDGTVKGYSYKADGATDRTVVLYTEEYTELNTTIVVTAEAIQAEGFEATESKTAVQVAFEVFDSQN